MRKSGCGVIGISAIRSLVFGLCLVAVVTVTVTAEAAENTLKKISATRLVYREIENGIDAFNNSYLITPRYLRIYDPDDNSGYILFDSENAKIYSVSHYDKSILVISQYPMKQQQKDYRVEIGFDKMADAPMIDGKPVYRYRVSAMPLGGGDTQICTDIQLVPDLLPGVADMLHRYMQVLSSQQRMNLEKTPPELRTPCFLQDQVFSTGEYYRKGLPVRVWHNNGKQRLLLDFGKVEVDSSLFTLPPDYRRFSIEKN